MDEKRKIQTDLAFIIEDDRDIATMYAQVVREGGFQVEVFYDGKEAYERLQIGPIPKLVFLDMHLPSLTGNEIAWEMWFELEATHIVIITADADMANIYKTKEEVDEVFVKPVPLDVLRDLAQNYLESGNREVTSEIQRRS
jgi:two-component system alkaline phosphatase synthesis response regulator PhoP